MFGLKLSLVTVALTAALTFATEYNSEYASLFTDDELDTITSVRVRREIRDLSNEEWQRIVDAMWVMKNTDTDTGEALYGDNFRNFDQIVCQHSRSGTTNGNIGHVLASFLTFHRALHMEFEESLMAIDSDIESVPYWDFRLDIDDLENSEIFGDKYFGSIVGNADEDYVVTNGKFAYWSVPLNTDSVACDGGDVNSFGYLRSTGSVLYQPYTVRYGTHHCKYGPSWYNGYTNWFSCLETDFEGDIYSFQKCWDASTHANAHHFIGGTWLREDQSVDSENCLDYFTTYIPIDSCVTCPECVVGVDEWEDCFCTSVSSSDGSDDTLTTTDCPSMLTEADLEISQLFGDFDDLPHSPNDPIFFFHHFNIDRLFYIWELMNLEYESDYFNYPTEGEILGVNLDDVCGYQYPFSNIWDSDNTNYTNRDILDNTRIAINAYQYDTIIDMIMGTDNDDDAVNIRTDDTIESSSQRSLFSYPLNTIHTTFWIMGCAAIVSALFFIYYYGICQRNMDFKVPLTSIDARSYQSF